MPAHGKFSVIYPWYIYWLGRFNNQLSGEKNLSTFFHCQCSLSDRGSCRNQGCWHKTLVCGRCNFHLNIRQNLRGKMKELWSDYILRWVKYTIKRHDCEGLFRNALSVLVITCAGFAVSSVTPLTAARVRAWSVDTLTSSLGTSILSVRAFVEI